LFSSLNPESPVKRGEKGEKKAEGSKNQGPLFSSFFYLKQLREGSSCLLGFVKSHWRLRTFPNVPPLLPREPALYARSLVTHKALFIMIARLSGGDGLAETGAALPRGQVGVAAGNLVGLLDNLLTLGQDELDVAGVRHVGVDATVGTVCSPPLLGGLVDLDVLDDQVAGVKTLGVGVGLSVLQETEQELGGLDGPASLGDTKLLALGGAASAAGVAAHGDGLLVLLDVLEEGDSTLQLPAVDGLGGLVGVLEGDAEVGTAGAGRLGGLDLGRGVSGHLDGRWVCCRYRGDVGSADRWKKVVKETGRIMTSTKPRDGFCN
jgi:hypothetical protein